MKKCTILLCLMCFAQFLFSQINLSGKIVDIKTKKTVDYVNIGIVHKSKGTVSNDTGSFHLKLLKEDINEKDTIQISRIGYETLKFSTLDFQSKLMENPMIIIQASPYELNEIIISQKDAKKNRIGYESNSREFFGFWKDSLALGGEHASKIRIKKGSFKLEDMSFNIVHSISDSLIVRVNIYEIEKGLPSKNISKKNILHTITKKRGNIIIDLSPYDIVVDDHFIISLELLKIYGKKVGVAISAYNDGLRSYTRLISQDRWRRMQKGTTVAFNLNTSLVKNINESSMKSKNSLRQSPQEVTILWDNSLSMNDRLLYKELQFLDAYFKKNQNVKVKFQTFGIILGEMQNHKVIDGNWNELRDSVKHIVYDGATNMEVLNKISIGAHTLLFTDGKRFYENINSDWKGTVFTINSKSDGNHKLLKSIAEDSDANYINLEKIDAMSLAIDYTNQYLVDNLEYGKKKQSIFRQKVVKGNVSDFNDPINKVTVQVKGTDRKVRTDSKGNFNIIAQTGDVLVYTYPGRESTTSVVNTTTKSLFITMPLGVNTLDEVILVENKKLNELNAPLQENVSTNFGVLNTRKTGFGVKQIKGDELSWTSQTIMEALKGKFPGIKIVGDGPHAHIILRVGSLSAAAWDVDGLPYPSDSPPLHINIQDIEHITIMPGSWAAVRYGQMAAGGIIIVRTKKQSFNGTKVANNPRYNEAVLGNDIYKGNAVFFEKALFNQPKYLQAIANENTYEKAYLQYLIQRKSYGHLSNFYLDVHNHFSQEWKSEKTANRILSNIEELFNDDVNALKVLAYTYEEKGLNLKAEPVYKTIYDIAPSFVQSLRDLAHIHKKNGNYKMAWSLYRAYIKKVKDSLTNSGTDAIVKNELLALLEKHGEDMGIDVSQYVFDTKKGDIIFSVEWNNPNTQFELQFVGPEQHYYNWNNAVDLSNAQLLKGNFSNSFTIDDLSKGEWLINIKYLGNYENTPSYLKFTIKDNNTGKETIKTVKLHTRNIFYKFMSISPPDQIVAH